MPINVISASIAIIPPIESNSVWKKSLRYVQVIGEWNQRAYYSVLKTEEGKDPERYYSNSLPRDSFLLNWREVAPEIAGKVLK